MRLEYDRGFNHGYIAGLRQNSGQAAAVSKPAPASDTMFNRFLLGLAGGILLGLLSGLFIGLFLATTLRP
jgi:predicted lipid-binding transport protein (Tim44 family)